jgi:TonB family protein
MKLLTGRRLGQSRGELAAAVLFSLLIHALTISGALILSFTVRPRVFVPPFYRVNLVDLPQDLPLLPPTASTEPPSPAPAPLPVPSTTAARPKQAARTAAAPRPEAAPKRAMPELSAEDRSKEHVAEDAPARPAGGKPEAVAVSTGSPEFRFPPYVAIVRDKVERNWNPPPGAKGARAKVLFKVLRSGRVGGTKLQEPSGNFYFDQAAMRAILSSSPFPPLPEGFFRDSETFSVDLMERE